MTNNPTTQQIDRDLAEKVMGWTPTGYTNTMEDGWLFQRDGELSIWVCSNWSPSASRDDCAEVLAKLTGGQWFGFFVVFAENLPDEDGFLACVQDETTQGFMAGVRIALTATPAQIALAVWRATCQ